MSAKCRAESAAFCPAISSSVGAAVDTAEFAPLRKTVGAALGSAQSTTQCGADETAKCLAVLAADKATKLES